MIQSSFFNLNIFETDPIIAWAVPGFLVLIGIELLVRHWERLPAYDGKDALASIAMGIGSAVINLFMKTLAFFVFWKIYERRVFTFPTDAWYSWVALFFLEDLAFYMHHRACHEIRLFWAGHVNHHSSQNYNLAVALRQSWGELTHKYIWWLWLPLIGFHPQMILMQMSISLIYQFWLHTETIKSLGPLEWIFNTPSHHRVHHGSNIRYLDRNHAGILIIWDRLFGTFQQEDEKVKYGITTNIHTYNPLKIATHEYIALWNDVRKAPGLLNKLKYIFMPPGWSHDGSSKTARQLREAL
ncbi:MAG: sterol desaturase family protein [Flavobacteriales bacterium]|nr:sterol desaturase family protein [Flavobacteriales bacterium]